MMYRDKLLKSVVKSKIFRFIYVAKHRGFSDARGPETKQTSMGETVDAIEVQHHEAMVNEWWDVKGKLIALHAMNEIRIPFIRNGLINTHRIDAKLAQTNAKYFTGVEILDVGCGGGILSEALARLGANVTGIDPSEQLVKLATHHAQTQSNIEKFTPPKYIASTIEQHSANHPRTYDAIVASEVIEHVSSKESFIKGCVAVLKPGGSLFFTTPNKTWMSWLANIIFAEYVLRVVPKGTHQYDKFITYTELSSMLEKEGCKTKLVNGLFYNIAKNQWFFSSTTTFLYALHAVLEK